MLAAPLVGFFLNRIFRNAKKWIGRQFQRDFRRQGDAVPFAQPGRFLEAFPQRRVVGLHRQREAQVAQRVLVGAVDPGVGRQRGQSRQGMMHLRRGAFEETAAAGGEQGVAAEQQRPGPPP